MKGTWNKYKSYLGYKKAVSKYPVMELTCAQSLWIVSDGGLFQNHGYYGWVIANDTSIIWEGRGRVPGNHDQFDSLRSESSGFLHALKVAYETITSTIIIILLVHINTHKSF